MLQIDDGITEKFTRGRTGNLKLHHPVEPLRPAADLPSAFEPLIKKLLRRRAEVSGLPHPPFPE